MKKTNERLNKTQQNEKASMFVEVMEVILTAYTNQRMVSVRCTTHQKKTVTVLEKVIVKFAWKQETLHIQSNLEQKEEN